MFSDAVPIGAGVPKTGVERNIALINNELPLITWRERKSFFGQVEVRTGLLEKFFDFFQIFTRSPFEGFTACLYEPDGGRVPLVSLRSLDGAFLGMRGASWDKVAITMREEGWLEENDAALLASLWRFGTLIQNTDMHFRNASFVISPNKSAKLAPVYDMLPMRYRPQAEGKVPGIQQLIVSDPSAREVTIAESFWQRIAASSLVSDEFRSIAATHAATLNF
jgi:hypothetical protein